MRQRPSQNGNAAEELISTPTSFRRTGSSVVIKDELEGVFDMSSNPGGESLISVGVASSTKLLRGVVIPASPSKALARRGKPISAKSSSVSSILSSRRDQSSEYDTPGTSAVATPAESTMKIEKSGKAAAQIQHRRTLPLSGANGKRKREEVDELADATMDADVLLARALQEEEYQEVAPSLGRTTKARRVVLDSEERHSTSDLSSDFSASEASIEVNRPRVKRIKSGGRKALPSRAARDSARKSIADRASTGIVDTEDSSLSDFISEFDFEDLDSEDFAGEEDDDLLQQPDTTAAPASAPIARRQHRIRRARTMPNSTAARRDPASWMTSRV